MKILLIGHEGYLGIGLHGYLAKQHRILGWEKRDDLFSLTPSLLAKEKIDAVINLSVMADRGSPTFELDAPTDIVNVNGARHLAKILKGTDIGWIQMSTREVFGPAYGPNDVIKTDKGLRPKWLVSEDFRFNPANFYGKSKLMAEFISESHPKANVIRLTTCYTDFDHPVGNWVVSLVRKAVQGGPVPLTQEGGQQFRDPLHIDDLGALMVLLLEKGIGGAKLNAGGGSDNLISLREFIQIANPKADIQSVPGGDYGYAFDIKKAAELTGWKPRVSVRERIPVLAENIRRKVIKPKVAA